MAYPGDVSTRPTRGRRRRAVRPGRSASAASVSALWLGLGLSTGLAMTGCGFELGDRECTQLISDATCGEWGRLYFTEATDDPEQLGGPPRPVATGSTYALRVGVEVFGAQGKDAGWVLEPRRLATAFPREDLFVIEEVGEIVEMRAIEPGTETLFVGTEESTRDRIQIQSIEPARIELELGSHSGAGEGDLGGVAAISMADVGLLPGAWVELSAAAFDEEFRPLAGYGLAEWSATAGLQLMPMSSFSDRVRVISTGELGGLSAVEGGEDLSAVFELVQPEDIEDVRVSLVDAFGTGATLDDGDLRVLLDRPVEISLNPYAGSGRLVIPAEDTPVLLWPGDDGPAVRVEPGTGVGHFVITPIDRGTTELSLAYAGYESVLSVVVQ